MKIQLDANMTIQENLQQTVDAFRKLKFNAGAWLMQAFVLRKGKVYEGRALPDDYPQGAPKYCFSNAQDMIREYPDLRYVEGFAVHPDIMFTFHHAWVIDEDDQIIDPTLEHPEKYQYMGVVFTEDQIDAARTEYSISVLDGIGINVRLILQLDPEMAQLDDCLREYAQKM